MQEYASWYLLRNARKSSSVITPTMRHDPAVQMWLHHEHKMRNWFGASTIWNIVELENVNELANVVFLESAWTKSEGLVRSDGANYRLLDRVATNAITSGYLHRSSDQRCRIYYEQLEAGDLKLEGDNRIAICSAEPSEIASNPSATFYLLDGVGRCLPYMILLKQGRIAFDPIEAFLAIRGDA